MALYCLCDAEMTKYERGGTQLVSRTTVRVVPEKVTMSVLQRPMSCIKTGAEQYLTEIDRTTLQQHKRRHFPNLDIYECPKCGTRVAREN
jgi:hypothetical protein